MTVMNARMSSKQKNRLHTRPITDRKIHFDSREKTDARTYPHTHNIKTHFVPDSPWDKKMFMTERTEKSDIHYTQHVMATRRKFRVPDVGIQ